jgi:hypothetical protein
LRPTLIDVRPATGGGEDVPAEGPTPPTIARVMEQVEEIRGFGFAHRVVDSLAALEPGSLRGLFEE